MTKGYEPKTIRRNIILRRSEKANHGFKWFLTLSCGHIEQADTQASNNKFRIACSQCDKENKLKLATLQK